MYAAELGCDLELVEIDLRGGENRQADYLARNPAGQLPALELVSGEIIAEVTAICEYLDEHASISLIGDNATERAQTRMWTRRVDLAICEPLLNGFRYSEGLPLFQDRMITVPEAAPGLKRVAQDRLAWLNEQLADGREFIVGSRFSLADVFLYCMLAFGNRIGQPIDPAHTHVQGWFDRIEARGSAKA
jgi:glutathione S-transferase